VANNCNEGDDSTILAPLLSQQKVIDTIQTIQVGKKGITSAKWVNERHIAVGLKNGHLVIVDQQTEQTRSDFYSIYNPINDLIVISENKFVIAQESGQVSLIDNSNKSITKICEGLRESARCVCYNQELGLFACGFQRSVKVFTVN
jgi:hypothetical protein